MLRSVTTVFCLVVSRQNRVCPLFSVSRLFAVCLACMAMTGAIAITAPQASAAKYAAIVIEESSGRVLFARNADKAR